MPWPIIAAIVIVAGATAIIALERWRPYDRGQAFLRDGFWIDLVTYALFQSYFLALVINLLIGWIDGWTGASRHGLVSEWPIAAQVAFFAISHDLYIYWFHRLQHGNRWLWRLHEAHHSARHVDWIAGSHSHSFEILINQSIEFGAMILHGASIEAILIKGAISAVWGMWIHANVDVRSGRLQWVINGPEMHRWHHAIDHPQGGSNFGTKLAIWDWIFGTAYRPAKKPAGYGLAEAYPRGYLEQHAFAFRPFERFAR
jgi:sterol desaturase/sphingolipid hydroxylase (fatty acid hydroxylase superfamily)